LGVWISQVSVFYQWFNLFLEIIMTKIDFAYLRRG